jgi:tRNA (guanine37-N1)-methyltransferase
MKFHLLTLFPGMFSGPLTESILKRAQENGLLEVALHNIRDYASDKHRTTDDYPYGGGAGMVMKVEPLAACLEAVRTTAPRAKVVLTSPRGTVFTQEVAQDLAAEPELIVICGRYEGVDERVKELFVDHELSIGDYVLTGGELAAMVVIDAVTRLLPGVLGSEESVVDESFSAGLLEYPQYTRPPEFRGLNVPDVLLSGNHAVIARWRHQQALRRTWQSRPDLLRSAILSPEDKAYLQRLQTAGES